MAVRLEVVLLVVPLVTEYQDLTIPMETLQPQPSLEVYRQNSAVVSFLRVQ